MFKFHDMHPPESKKCYQLKEGSANLYNGADGTTYNSFQKFWYQETCFSNYLLLAQYTSKTCKKPLLRQSVKISWNQCYRSSKMSNGNQFYIKYKKQKLISTKIAVGVVVGICLGFVCCCVCFCFALYFGNRKNK